jgi:hypothetical protein
MSITKPKPAAEAESLAGQLQLARIGLVKAESTLGAAREAARVAKRRRKEAKLAARRAKREVKRAKANLGQAREIIAKLEAKMAAAGFEHLRKGSRTRNARRNRQTRSHTRKVPVRTRTPQPVPPASPAPASGGDFAEGHTSPPPSATTASVPDNETSSDGATAV